MIPYDITGREIKPGMTVAYAARYGNTAGLSLYHIYAIKDGKLKARPVSDPTARISTIATSETQTIIVKD